MFKLFIAFLFVISCGSLFSAHFRKNKLLISFASLVSIASAYYLIDSVLADIEDISNKKNSELVLNVAQLKDKLNQSESSNKHLKKETDNIKKNLVELTKKLDTMKHKVPHETRKNKIESGTTELVIPDKTEPILDGECLALPKQIDNYIANHVYDVRGAEYCQGRDVYLDNNIAIVTYSIEGACFEQREGSFGSCGNHHEQYVIGLINNEIYLPVQIGSRHGFAATSIQVIGKKVLFHGVSVGENDSACCPTLKGTKTLYISDGRFSSSLK